MAAAIIQRPWRRFCDSSRRLSASFSESFAALAWEAACHSRKISNIAAPKMNTKKKSSLLTMGPRIAISPLLEGSQRASLNSCKPLSPNWNATSIKMTLVAAKNRPSGMRSVPLKKNNPTATAAAIPAIVPIQVCKPSVESSTARRISASSAPSRNTSRNTKRKTPQPAAFPVRSA